MSRGRLTDYVRVRAQLRVLSNGCWGEWSGAINNTGQPVACIQGRTVAIRTWLRGWFRVPKARLVPCDTPGCLCPLHQPPRVVNQSRAVTA